jgi:hypothetical protein
MPAWMQKGVDAGVQYTTAPGSDVRAGLVPGQWYYFHVITAPPGVRCDFRMQGTGARNA